jgi:hypothetical protein
MTVRQRERLKLLRGHYDADVVADETVEGISNNIICECKFWSTNIPAKKDVCDEGWWVPDRI